MKHAYLEFIGRKRQVAYKEEAFDFELTIKNNTCIPKQVRVFTGEKNKMLACFSVLPGHGMTWKHQHHHKGLAISIIGWTRNDEEGVTVDVDYCVPREVKS